MSGDSYSYYARWGRPRREPAACAKAVFDGITWRDVPDYCWARLTRHANEMTLAAMGTGIGVVGDRLVQFAGHSV